MLIDEACVPLVLSERRENAAQITYHHQALDLAARLVAQTDFALDERNMGAVLSEHGRDRLETETAALGLAWRNRLHRDETVATALAALHLYVRDRHFLVRDRNVAIIDQTTGRLAPGRAWSRGLQQMIEIREGLSPSAENVTVAQLGSMLTVFFTGEPPRDYATAKRADTDRFARFFRAMLDAGVYLPPSQFEVMMVSLAHQQRDFDQTLAAAKTAFAAAR